MRNWSLTPRAVLLAAWLLLLPRAAPAAGGAPPDEKRVGVLTDNYPFSFRNEQGRVDGFAYDLTREIEQVMGLRFVRVEGDTREINGAFREGRLDLLQSYAQFPERESAAAFSVPYVTMAGAIVVRNGGPLVHTLQDLRGLRVAVHRGSLGETVLRRAGLEASIVPAGSVEDTLEQVSQGKADATLVGRLSGLALAHHLGLKNLRLIKGDVPGYEVRYCLAVQRADHELLAHVNEGLAILVRTGRYDAIYRKWFEQVQPVGYSALQVTLAVSVGLALALAVSLWAVVRLRRLQARILLQQQELRASEKWHRGIFNGAHDALLVLERTELAEGLAVRQINAAGLKLLGLRTLPNSGAPLRTLLGADGALAERLERVATSGTVVEFEYARAGDTGWWRVAVGPLGRCTLLSLGDVTEAVHGREQLRQQEQRLMQSQKLEAVGRLAGGIAHDFNNILTAIIGNTELSLMTLPPERPEVDGLNRVMHAAGRARQLVKQILSFSRRQETTRQALDAAPVIEETIGFLRSAARGAITFENRRLGTVPPILADSAQLHQVLMNIGTNAVQAMRGAPGRLTFDEQLVELTVADASRQAALKPGRYVRISICDTGPGIPPDVLPRIFEPFFSTKAPGEGTGLGLSVVHGIMQRHGGAVTVYSEPGRGSRFDLYFPVAEAHAAARATPAAIVPRGRGEMILVVDDDVEGMRTVRDILLQLGYRVAAFERATEALEAFTSRPGAFALVLTDLTMPGMTGLQMVTQVRLLASDVPVILASGFFTEGEEREADQLRISRLLHKPLSVSLLNDAVAGCLGAESGRN